jgi:hypothetical protein
MPQGVLLRVGVILGLWKSANGAEAVMVFGVVTGDVTKVFSSDYLIGIQEKMNEICRKMLASTYHDDQLLSITTPSP